MTVLMFYFTTPNTDRWGWKVESDDGKVIARSEASWPYYLDALADARAHGHRGPPTFAPAPPATIVVPPPASAFVLGSR